MNDSKEKWNFIAANYLKLYNQPEAVVQPMWEITYLPLCFGYSSAEIVSHPNIQVGSSKTIIPDILVKNGGKNLFIVELKQYNLPFSESYMDQLCSYMKLSNSSIGILVCSEIYIYYYDYANNMSKKYAIKFEQDNPDGEKFIELFEQENFSADAVKKFIDDNNRTIEHIAEIQKLLDTKFIIDITKNYLRGEGGYADNEIDEALKDFDFNVVRKNSRPIKPTPENGDYYERRYNGYNSTDNNKQPQDKGISKSAAIAKLIKEGQVVYGTVTWASKNATAGNYWANPQVAFLDKNWSLILNDWVNRRLHLFNIPAHSISVFDIRTRNDMDNKIDLQIQYMDEQYRDNRSGLAFARWLVYSTDY